MAHPLHHAQSSVRKWGGAVEDYLAIHAWFDESKKIVADFRHRALRHHAEGVFLAEQVFGVTITTSAGREIPVRWIGEQHVTEDLGFTPSAADWLRRIEPAPWMNRSRRLSRALAKQRIDELNARRNAIDERTRQLRAARPAGPSADDIEALLDSVPDLRPVMEEAPPEELADLFAAFDLTATYDKEQRAPLRLAGLSRTGFRGDL